MRIFKPRSIARPRWRKRFVRVHSYLSIAAASLWLIQAMTGVLIVFHWQIEDATIAGRHAMTDLHAIESRLIRLAPAGSGRTIVSVWTTGGDPDRYDVTVSAAGKQRAVRIAGDGTVLRDHNGADLSWSDTMVVMHQTLLAGEFGGWIVGISGALLLSNLVFGLIAGWPQPGTWRRAIVPIRIGGRTARTYSWHRALGLMGAVPALLLVSAGVLLAFKDGTGVLVGFVPVTMAAQPGRPVIGFETAVKTAQRAIPGSRLSAVASMPSFDDATFRIQLIAPGELRRAYGTSAVFVDAVTGRVRGVYRATAGPPGNVFIDTLYAIHTGELASTIGRVLVMVTGLWLATMIFLGLMLWQRRRNARRGKMSA